VLPTLDLARSGRLAERFRRMIEQPAQARHPRSLGACYTDPSALTDEAIVVYLEPLVSSEERAANMHRYWTSFDVQQTVAVEPLLRRLTVPTQIVWATDDIFFDIALAHWLRDTIPGVVRLIDVPGAKLFFPEERPEALATPLRELWIGAVTKSAAHVGGQDG
jgi:pimeloyl-ACP methyl ester carboxylesterase